MVNQKVIYLPVQVSPLIKFTRWALLVTGIIYGYKKHKTFSVIETARREEEERLRPMKEALLAREKAIRSEIQMKELEEFILGPSSAETNQENPVNEQ